MKFKHGHIDDGYPFPNCQECQPKPYSVTPLTYQELTDLYNQLTDSRVGVLK